jgi:hypothetical protein
MEKDYKEAKSLREMSGFGYGRDDVHCVPTAEPKVWGEIAKIIKYYFLL